MMDQDAITIILAALLAVSEALAFIPGLKDNGIFKLLLSLLKSLKDLLSKKG